MGASPFEYRFRSALYLLIFVVGFWPFWEPWLGLSTKSTWLILSATMARHGWLSFQGATMLLLVLAIVFAALGAWLRLWGAAYMGGDLVHAASMRSEGLVTDGPYRRTRNPLYLGTLLHTVGVALLMPPAGALFAVAAIWILQVRLVLAEEGYLARQIGPAYREYETRVPRFLPTPKPMTAAGGQSPHWLQAILSESYVLGVVITLAAFGWDFNALPLLRGILISLGVSLVLRALLPWTSRTPVSAG